MSDAEREQFFIDLEKEAGGPLVTYALGEIHEGVPSLREPLVGLFYATEQNFFFQTFPRKNWFTNILGTFRKKQEEKPYQIKIPLSAFRSVVLKKPKGIWHKLFASPIPLFTVEYADAEGVSRSVKFSLLSKENEFFGWLNGAVSPPS